MKRELEHVLGKPRSQQSLIKMFRFNAVMCSLSYLVALLLTFAARSVGAQPPQRPNILFIFSDDHAYQAVSAYGYKLNNTPNIDRIAREGMRFDRCLTTNSLCGPSRACVLTGKYSHLNGFYNNTNSRFDGSQVTFPKLLQQAGYQTAIVGKWHLVSDPTGFDTWDILPRARHLLQSANDSQRRTHQAPGLCYGHNHGTGP